MRSSHKIRKIHGGTDMAERRTVTVYFDYKSPYAFLAKDPAYELERDFPVRVDWLPYTLDIPSFLGSARVDDGGQVVEEQRNAHQWRRVRYSYMDCRRQARKRGLVIRGPQRIWDSTIASRGMLYAKRQGDTILRCYHDAVFERFWKRELDIEDPDVVCAVLAEAGADTMGFPAHLIGEGRDDLELVCRAAECIEAVRGAAFDLDGEPCLS